MAAPRHLDPDVLWGDPGCCSECGSPFLPGPEQVSSMSYGLCDPTAPNCVRGGKFFTGRCPACGARLISEEFTGKQWADLDPRSVYWRRDHWTPLFESDAASDSGR
jgi:hypothetical protein